MSAAPSPSSAGNSPIWRWLKRYWRIPLLLIFGILAYVLWRKWQRGPVVTPFTQVAKELDAIRAGTEVERIRAEMGHTEALKYIDDKYAAEMRAMDEAEREQTTRLRGDPEALTRFIVRGSE